MGASLADEFDERQAAVYVLPVAFVAVDDDLLLPQVWLIKLGYIMGRRRKYYFISSAKAKSTNITAIIQDFLKSSIKGRFSSSSAP